MKPNDMPATSWEDIDPDEIIYTAELSGQTFTKKQLIEECKGNEETATALYFMLEWQHPATLLDEWIREGEIDENFKRIQQ